MYGLSQANNTTRRNITVPFVLVLGTAQDGGLPQIGCNGPNCRAARQNPKLRRMTASLLITAPRAGSSWLVDATPDIKRQLDLAHRNNAISLNEQTRTTLFDGIFLTHAHTGHYTGLMHLGKEAYSSVQTPVYASRQMCQFLAKNAPWDLLVSSRNIVLNRIKPEQTITLTEDTTILPLHVPHRNEYTDTFAFIITGPQRSILYLPDIDAWQLWERSIEQIIASVDLAIVDGTFYDAEELPQRNLKEIPHPFISESIRRFANLPESQRSKIVFTHLNHTNPAVDPDSTAAAEIRSAGMSVAKEGQKINI